MDLSSTNIHYDSNGLIPAIIQDNMTQQVLMMAYMNATTLNLTLETGQTHFWSRSRKEIWHKGATSGNIQNVVDITLDCDQDTLLIKVIPAGPACHTGAVSCFFTPIKPIHQD
jgi:phosphoribosyl-ATP pyrophosphohydrolase/phosphoribosyl-AMP cyclohydrolase